ncbi:translation initiation factor Eif4e [Basidiobolus meristosporus CBS 931.73]|uniref:Translation initiation factor Eif4e n=1 Tax=Basidiobolus meristosporus CBS 931.73 TaxID=1314790 RepID=A0A1Y1YGQ7_9FUNG|nr:translation initiation factor Eif4e [Basidiobolus meristosporus CBS 931.73]|eukprot:ORX97201.1 translation initiation factor Eif4e [Basidiobolus meristosporus CBS 931.73]
MCPISTQAIKSQPHPSQIADSSFSVKSSIPQGTSKGSPVKSGPEMITVFTDPINFNVKHPLNNSWTLWYDSRGKKTNQSSWSQCLREVVSFNTVEDFWGAYNNLTRVSNLAPGSNYHLFKENIKPMWEDAANSEGGKWVIQFSRKAGEEINHLWLHSILCCIGETFLYEDQISGVVVSVRKGFYRLALWTRTSDDRQICEAICSHLKVSLNLSSQQQLEFQTHADATHGGLFNKGRYVV